MKLNVCHVGVPPRVMGIGPLYAIPMVLKNAGLTKEDVDLFEVGPGLYTSAQR